MNTAQKLGGVALDVLFRAMDGAEIRYCVLHSWNTIEQLQSDLDIAVHPEDLPKLDGLIGAMSDAGFSPVHCINYAVGAYYFVFVWEESYCFHTISLDVISQHCRSGLLLSSGPDLVRDRRRFGGIWIASPSVEFTYILSKQILKRALNSARESRLRALIAEIGSTKATQLAAQFFGEELAREVVDACIDGRLITWSATLRHSFIRRWTLRGIATEFQDRLRKIRRWLHPTGLCIALLGPDGAGKSTLAQNIQQQPAGFRRFAMYHWRPMVFFPAGEHHTAKTPYHRPARAWLPSMLILLVHFLDHFVGYWTSVRTITSRTGLVIFDRYFDDVLADPLRYRYGGPAWWPRFLRRFLANPDLTFILDASEETISPRKRECAPDLFRLQREAYLALVNDTDRTCLVAVDEPADRVCARCMRAIAAALNRRLKQREPAWFGGRA